MMASYSQAHSRVRKERGSARDYSCVGCGEPADEWSYDNCDLEERSEVRDTCKYPLKYSLDPDHYRPLCNKCHRQADFQHRLSNREYRRPWGYVTCPSCGQPPGQQCRRASGVLAQ